MIFPFLLDWRLVVCFLSDEAGLLVVNLGFWPFISYILFAGMFKDRLQSFYRLKIVVNVCLSKNRLID